VAAKLFCILHAHHKDILPPAPTKVNQVHAGVAADILLQPVPPAKIVNLAGFGGRLS
jgi:hypothetical protein